ncbi:MAG: hypothetical protein AB7O88_08960 [Reyranellaceae bacterium]
MSPEEQLFRIERMFWYGGQDAFLQNLDARCLLAFPQAGQMHGVYSRDEVARTATSANRWRDLEMSDRVFLQLDDHAAMISYRADVVRADGQAYAALVSSAYVDRGEGWKLAAHQHSPIQPGPKG